MYYIAIIFYVLAVADFALSWMGINITHFLGPMSNFSPILFGGLGFVFQKLGESGGAGLKQSEEDSLPEQYRNKKPKTRKSSK